MEFADFAVTGKVDKFKSYNDILRQVGPLYTYFPKSSKSCLIAKEHFYGNAKEHFKN